MTVVVVVELELPIVKVHTMWDLSYSQRTSCVGILIANSYLACEVYEEWLVCSVVLLFAHATARLGI